MKKKHGFVRRLRYLGLAGIIVFGFMTIVATGDGGDSGDSGGGPIAPIIDVISDTSATEGTPYTGPTPSLSQGTLPVTWSLVSGPSGMNVDSSTGVVSWPDPTVSGSPHLITIRATNTAGSDDESWQLTVTSSPISPAAGQWCGSPGDLTVDFVVASGGDGLEEITIKFTDFSCGGSISNGSITFSSSPPYPIIDSSFEESFALSGNKTVTIKGTFNSTQSASGTYEAVFYGDTCTETWDAAQESGAACAPPSYDATGTWSTVETETYNSDGEFLEVKHGTATISQTNSSFKLEADEGEIFDGTVCGTVYTFSGSWEMQEPGGQWGTATMEGSVELTSEINFEGNFTFTWTNGTHIYSEKWDVVGTKQAGCGEGLPLTISDLSFPTTVTAGSSYDGSVDYQGSFEDIANPRMFLKIPFSGGIALTSVASAPTASNCRIHFKGIIPDDLKGTGSMYFKLIDYSGDEDGFGYNWDNNAVSNQLLQDVTIQ